jgi:hypothetical protein
MLVTSSAAMRAIFFMTFSFIVFMGDAASGNRAPTSSPS